MNRVRNSFLVLVPGFAVVFLVYAVIHFFFGPERGILPSFTFAWHLLAAFESACGWIIPLVAASILLSFGIFLERDSDEPVRTRGPVMFVLFLAFLCAGLLLVLKPMSERRSARIAEASDIFTEELREGSRSLEAGEWARTAQALDVMGSISGNDKRYLELRKKFSERPDEENPGRAPAAKSAKKPLPSANALYLEAMEAYARGQYYHAHSLATKAARMDPTRLDAVRLASEAWNKIGALEDSIEERSQRDIAKQKRSAYQMLKSGDPVAAYSRFLELKRKAPGDGDIDRYLKESLEEMKSVAFFMDEVGRLSRLPRSRSVFMKLPAVNQNESVFLAASSLYLGEEVAYMTDFEFLSVSGGRVVKKIYARYAKARAGRVLLACYDRADPNRSWKPLYLMGATSREADNVLELDIGREDLELAAVAASGPLAAGMADLYKVYARGGRISMDTGPFVREGLLRLHTLILVIFTALFSFFLGARYRYPGSKPPYFQAILVGGLAFFTAGVIQKIAAWAGSSLAVALSPRTGSMTEIISAFLIFLLVHGLSVGISLIFIAGHRDKPAT